MNTFFNDDELTSTEIPSIEEIRARTLPPDGFEDCRIVQVGEHLVWKKSADILPGDLISFYDGDCRNVLKPNDPRLKA